MVGEKFKAIRKAKGLTLEGAAKMLGINKGLTAETVSPFSVFAGDLQETEFFSHNLKTD